MGLALPFHKQMSNTLKMLRTVLNTVLIIGLLGLGACEPESFTYTIENEPGDVKVLMAANRLSPLDGFTIDFTVQAMDRPEAKLSKEVYINELSAKTVAVTWETDYTAIISFLQRDDTHMRFKLVVNEDMTRLSQIIEQESF